MEIILASKSPRRREILENTKVRFSIEESQIDEVIKLNELPKETVMRLAYEKALDVANRNRNSLVIGADTIVVINDTILGKPKDDIISDIFDVLRTVASAIDENKFPINEYSITKQLAKKIDDYTDLKALPHVKVAKRLKEKGDLSIKVSSYIPYVVCLGKDGTSSKSIAERSYHPKEIEEDPTLVIDKNW